MAKRKSPANEKLKNMTKSMDQLEKIREIRRKAIPNRMVSSLL